MEKLALHIHSWQVNANIFKVMRNSLHHLNRTAAKRSQYSCRVKQHAVAFYTKINTFISSYSNNIDK